MQAITKLYKEAYSGIPRDLWLLAVVALINRSGTMVLPFLSLYLTAERGVSPAEAGQLIAVYGVGAMVGAYLGGWLSDHIGAIRAQQLSLVTSGAGFLVLGAVRERCAIATALFFVSIVVEAFRPAVMASFAERSSDESRAKAFAFLRLAANLGVSIGPAIGGVLALYSYRWLFVADAATCWLAAILLLKLPPDHKGTSPESEQTAPRSPWRDLPFLHLLGVIVVSASVLFQIFSTLPLYLREHIGYRENTIGMLLALNALLIVAFEMVLIHSIANRDRLRVVGIGLFLLCAGYGLMPYGTSFAYLAFTVCVWTLGEMLYLPIVNVIVSERAGHGVQGRYMGMLTMAFSLAFIIAPLAGTYTYETFGPRALWQAVGVLGVGLWMSVAPLRRSLGGRRQQPAAAGE